ncbi:MAG: hypothetical protein AAFQ77_01705 [Myxococcota bacterium]
MVRVLAAAEWRGWRRLMNNGLGWSWVLAALVALTACGGDDGADGAAGVIPLTRVSEEPAGVNCPGGGTRLDVGADENGNGTLEDREIDSSSFVCNAQDGTTVATSTSSEPPGDNCVFGGTRLDIGLDRDQSGALESDEVTGTRFICASQAEEFSGLIYVADSNLTGLQELFSVSPDGQNRRKLIGPRSIVGTSEWAVSPDGTQIAVWGDLETLLVDELFVVSLVDTERPRKISGDLAAGADVSSVSWSPDGRRLLYLEGLSADREAFTIAPDGTGKIRISGNLGSGAQVLTAAWSPDGSRIAYVAFESSAVPELYVVASDGSEPIKVNGELVAGGSVSTGVRWSRDGSRLAYRADQRADEVFELFTVAPDGTENVRVNGDLVAGGSVLAIAWSPDGSRLAYRADQETDEVFEAYTVAPDGTENIRVSGELVSGGDVFSISLVWSPDSSWLLYLADQDTDDVLELYTVAPDGTGNRRVNRDLVAGGRVSLPRRPWSPDSSRIVYQSDAITDGVFELFTAAPDGTEDTRVNGEIAAGRRVLTAAFTWSPDSSRLAYWADEEADGSFELRVVNADGTGAQEVASKPDNGFGRIIWR